MPSTPQDTAASEASILSSLSRSELGDAFVAAMRGEREWDPIRAEFSRRFWERQAGAMDEPGHVLELFPWDRGLKYHRSKSGATYR